MLRRMGLVAAAALLFSCATADFVRPQQSAQSLQAARRSADETFARDFDAAADRLLQRVKTRLDESGGGDQLAQPAMNLLLISGGGDWGAFAAGFLKGWEQVAPGPMELPKFDVVTGVSTGALIAPFAYLGDPASIEEIVSLYRHPQRDLYEPRGVIALLRGASAYARVPGLERALDASLTLERIERIADEGSRGRLLAVNVTDVDTQEMHVWDIVKESQRAVRSGDIKRIHDILLASAAIPGLFPPRELDGVLYVDGGLTGNIIFGGPVTHSQHDTIVERWQHKYPHAALPRIRYWIIFNNEIRWPPEVVDPKWSTLLARSMTASSRAATLNCIRLLILQAALEKLEHGVDIEVRMVAVPDGWVAPTPGAFVPETMNALADLGERMGADPSSWRTSLVEAD
jgi:Patatin-like phospholipase